MKFCVPEEINIDRDAKFNVVRLWDVDGNHLVTIPDAIDLSDEQIRGPLAHAMNLAWGRGTDFGESMLRQQFRDLLLDGDS